MKRLLICTGLILFLVNFTVGSERKVGIIGSIDSIKKQIIVNVQSDANLNIGELLEIPTDNGKIIIKVTFPMLTTSVCTIKSGGKLSELSKGMTVYRYNIEVTDKNETSNQEIHSNPIEKQPGDNYKIVVLPFDKLNKEKNAELETLTVGISETLSGALSTVDNFVVIDSNRVKRHLLESAEFKQAIGVETGDIENLRELTKDKLNADYIVYGTFNKIGGNIQLSAKFMNVTSGEVIKGSNVHGKYPDEIFNLQEQLAKDLTDKISGKSSSKQKNSIEEYSQSTGNYTAYQYYIKGRMDQIQYDVKNYPLAIENYNKALKYDPKYALAWAGLAEVNALWGYQIQYAKGNSAPYLKVAIEQGKKAVEFGPNLYQTHRALSMAYLNNSDFDNAQISIDEAYKLNKQDAETMQIKAQLKNYGYKEMGAEGTESNKYIMESLALNPELIIAKWSLAHSYSTINKNDLALKEYLEILNINPKHAPALHGIALIYYGMQDYENAEEYAIRVVAADPKTAQHHYTLGLSYYQLKKYDLAIPSFEQAVKLDPKYEDSMYMIANCYWYQSKWDKAYKYYNKVLEINPKNTEAVKWRDDSYSKMKK